MDDESSCDGEGKVRQGARVRVKGEGWKTGCGEGKRIRRRQGYGGQVGGHANGSCAWIIPAIFQPQTRSPAAGARVVSGEGREFA